MGSSYPFSIKPNVHRDLAKAAVKAFYFQRMSTELLPEHTGDWSRPAGHPEEFNLPNWGNVGWLGYYSLLRFQADLDIFPTEKLEAIKEVLMQSMDAYLEHADEESPYQVVMGQDVKDFVWGSNAVAANQGIALIQAFRLTEKNEAYLQKALANLDYIMGRNATGYGYVTGHGHKTPMDPHHRP